MTESRRYWPSIPLRIRLAAIWCGRCRWLLLKSVGAVCCNPDGQWVVELVQIQRRAVIGKLRPQLCAVFGQLERIAVDCDRVDPRRSSFSRAAYAAAGHLDRKLGATADGHLAATLQQRVGSRPLNIVLTQNRRLRGTSRHAQTVHDPSKFPRNH